MGGVVAIVCGLLLLVLPTSGPLAVLAAATLAVGGLAASRRCRRWATAHGIALWAVAAAFGVLAWVVGPPAILVRMGLPPPAGVVERWHQTTGPRLAPALVVEGRAMRYWITTAEGARSVTLVLGDHRLPAVGLGHGLWRVDWDPARWPVAVERGGPGRVAIEVDGQRSGHPVERRSARARPRLGAVDPDAGLAFLTCRATHRLLVLERAGGLARHRTAAEPVDVAWPPGGDELWVAHAGSRAIGIHDRRDGARLAAVEVEAVQTAVAAASDGSLVFAALGGTAPRLVAIATGSRRVVASHRLTAPVDRLVAGRDGLVIARSVAGGSLDRFALAADELVREASLALPRPPRGLVLDQDAGVVWATVSGWRADPADLLGNHQVEHQLLRIDLATWQVAGPLRLDRGGGAQQRPGDTVRGADPAGIARFGERLAVAFSGSGELLLLDPADPIAGWSWRSLPEAVGRTPVDIAAIGGGRVVVVDPVAGSVAVLDPEGRALRLHRLVGSDAELASEDPVAARSRRAEQAFWAAARSGVSCQSCHLEAGSDQARHAIGHHVGWTAGIRGLGGTRPYLRGGNYRDAAMLYRQLVGGILGGHRDAELVAGGHDLDVWIDGLPRLRNPAWADTDDARQARGWAAFRRAGCVDCHAPPLFTDLARHREGRLFPDRESHRWLDTPSLLSSWDDPRLLLDGRAGSLEAVLDESGPHGRAEELAPQVRADLVAFLESL